MNKDEFTFAKIFTVLFNIVFFGLIFYIVYLIIKLSFLSLGSIFSFGGPLNSPYVTGLNQSLYETVFTFIIILILLAVLSYAFSTVCLFGIFEKTGTQSFKAYIPIYNNICLIKDIMGSGWYILLFLVPMVNFIFGMYLLYKLGDHFGKTSSYCVLLMIFPTIMLPLLAYDDSKYQKIDTYNTVNSGTYIETKKQNIVVLFFKWLLTIILLLLSFLLFLIAMQPSNRKAAMYLINAIIFGAYGLLICPLITKATLKYKTYFKYKKIIVISLLIFHFLIFFVYFTLFN